MTGIELSVVIADINDEQSLAATLGALDAACGKLAVERIVVRAGGREPSGSASGATARLRVIERPPGTLTPTLWGAGAEVARGPVVAFTTTQMRVAPGWGPELLRAISGEVVGAAGAISLADRASAVTAATHFLRFSAFLPESVPSGGASRGDIPGDNAAYSRVEVARHADLLRDGFWEVEFHRRFEHQGLALRLLSGAEATMVGPVDLRSIVRQRFAHAAAFGASRVQRHGASRVKLLLAAPFVPALLIARIGRRVLPFRRYHGPFIVALPWLALLAAAWALGEAVGAFRVDTSPGDRSP